MFFPIRFKTHVQLQPEELDERIEERLTIKLKKRYEGVCSRFGYIKPDTLTILTRSLGSFMKPHFNGHTRYEVLMVGEVCNPTQGMVVTAKVMAKNNLGILAESSVVSKGVAKPLPLLDILIPRRSAGIASEIDIDTVAIGDEVFVEVLGKRYQLNDTKISIIGRIVKERPGIPANETTEAVDDTNEDTETEFDEDAVDDEDGDNEEVGGGDDDDGDEDGDENIKPAKSSEIADAKRFAMLLRESVKAGVGKDKEGVADDVDAEEEDEFDEEDDDDGEEESEKEEEDWE